MEAKTHLVNILIEMPVMQMQSAFDYFFSQTKEELSECITKRHAAFESYRDSVISKWSEKTKLASGKLSSKVSKMSANILMPINQGQ